MLQLKPLKKIEYLQLVSGARAIFLLSTVLQTVLHLWDFTCINLVWQFSQAEIIYVVLSTAETGKKLTL